MEIKFNNDKRQVSVLVPCFIENNSVWVYLQKRSPDAVRLPDKFGFWGGGVDDGETPEQALIREAREELGKDIAIEDVKLFNHYLLYRADAFIYMLPVTRKWADGVIIGEGEYGKWFSVEEALARKDIILGDKMILNDIERAYLKNPIQ